MFKFEDRYDIMHKLRLHILHVTFPAWCVPPIWNMCFERYRDAFYDIFKTFIFFLFMPLWDERLNPLACLSTADVYGDSIHASLLKKNLYFVSTVLAAHSFYRHSYSFFVRNHLHYLRHASKVFVVKQSYLTARSAIFFQFANQSPQ